jgi:hypothetical protein
MDKSSSWKANISSASQEIPRFLWKPKFITPSTTARYLSLF